MRRASNYTSPPSFFGEFLLFRVDENTAAGQVLEKDRRLKEGIKHQNAARRPAFQATHVVLSGLKKRSLLYYEFGGFNREHLGAFPVSFFMDMGIAQFVYLTMECRANLSPESLIEPIPRQQTSTT